MLGAQVRRRQRHLSRLGSDLAAGQTTVRHARSATRPRDAQSSFILAAAMACVQLAISASSSRVISAGARKRT